MLMSCAGLAQEIKVVVSGRNVTTVDPFSYQIQVDCDCDIDAPDLTHFEILQQDEGQMQSQMNINGKVTTTCTTTRTYILRGKAEGQYTIGAASVDCDGKRKKSDAIKINVLDANDIHAQNEGVAKFYYKLVPSKEVVQIGEPFTLTFYLFAEQNPEHINSIVPGNALGLSRTPLYDETSPQHSFPTFSKTVKGKKYQVVELRKELCYANNPGVLGVGAYFGRSVEMYDFWETKYFEGYSNSLQLDVKKIPVETPENFYGLAGQFEMTHDISETSLAANRSFEMTVRIEGTGNFHALKEPEFALPDTGFLFNDPHIEESFEATEQGMTGWKEYTYVITPTEMGEYVIPAYSFSFYDWKTKRIKQVATQEFTLKVSKGKDPAIVSSGYFNPTQIVEDDIRYIHTKSDKFFTYNDFLFGRLWFWALLAIPFVGLGIFVLIKKRRSLQTSEEKLAVEQKETKRSTIKDIQKLKKGDASTGMRELKRSLEEYFMTNLQMGRSALSKQNVLNSLSSKNVSTELQNEFSEIWDNIEMAQYAPISDSNMGELIDRTESLVQNLNKQL